MNKKYTYSLFHFCYVIVMIVSLLWLTVGTPYAWAHHQEVAALEKQSKAIPSEESDGNYPINNTTEEKVPSNNSFSEEYLHEIHITDLIMGSASLFAKCPNADTYIAYHGELLVPPPNVG